MHVAYIGNFEPEHSTENEVRRALENNGHTVLTFQEGDPLPLMNLSMCLRHPTMFDDGRFDFVLWTRTKGLAEGKEALYWRMLALARGARIPVVGYHLDRWWGLKRQEDITEHLDPFFAVDLLCTADGGHQEQWDDAGVNHVWFPPAISERNCYLGTPRGEYRSDIAFVGSWEGGYHEEDTHRPALIQWLKDNYSQRVKFWPRHGERAIRGSALNDLYASVKVVVGTSCLAPKVDGSPMTHYWSDRIPETLGRGGLLVHPRVEGLHESLQPVFTYPLGDLDRMGHMIALVLDMTTNCQTINKMTLTEYRQQQCDRIREHHTYELRMQNLIQLLNDKGML